MTHEELLKKYNVNATEFNEQKEEIANIFLKELANMQQAEAEGPGFESCLTVPYRTRSTRPVWSTLVQVWKTRTILFT